MSKKVSRGAARRIVLAGNPNVGKSTLFNLLTKSRVHTGNWAGKTVSVSEGYGVHNKIKYSVADLPGISSLTCPDAEESAAAYEIARGAYDCLIIVADATHLTRSLALALKILELTPRCVLAVNLCDEAERLKIELDRRVLEFILGIRVVLCSFGKKRGVAELIDAAFEVAEGVFSSRVFTPVYSPNTEKYLSEHPSGRKAALLSLRESGNFEFLEDVSDVCMREADKIASVSRTVKKRPSVSQLDKIFCSPVWGIPIMLALLGTVIFITVKAANCPSELLAALFANLKEPLSDALSLFLPKTPVSLLTDGVYSTLTAVISVMLPPVVIFFPLFSLLEDFGYLPRVAFNLDDAFRRCGSCGKQALSMCMSLGCTCVGISNSAIIASKRERLIAVLTSSFMPCNGKFGGLIGVIGVFFACGRSELTAVGLLLVLIFSVGTTFLVSYALSRTVLKGERSVFTIELPPYRSVRPLRAVRDALSGKALSVLLRAASIAAPSGLLIWFLGNVSPGGVSILCRLTELLTPAGRLLGLDGEILLAFVLGFPANEIVLPLAAMAYMGESSFYGLSDLYQIFIANGWTWQTALSFIVFSVFHWPCGSAVLTAYRETKSLGVTAAAVILPTAIGVLLCALLNLLLHL